MLLKEKICGRICFHFIAFIVFSPQKFVLRRFHVLPRGVSKNIPSDVGRLAFQGESSLRQLFLILIFIFLARTRIC